MGIQLRVGGLYQMADGTQIRITSLTCSNVPNLGAYTGNIVYSDGTEINSAVHWFEDGRTVGGWVRHNLVAESNRAAFVKSIIEAGLLPPDAYTWMWGPGIPAADPACLHDWVETPGFSRMYKDCRLCKAKWEDVK